MDLINLLYQELLRDGYCKKLAFVGASDSHTSDQTSIYGPHFGLNYTIVFAEDNSLENFKKAIKAQHSVACSKKTNVITNVYGRYRYSVYARFLIEEYFNHHIELCKPNGLALKEGNKALIETTQKAIDDYEREFFGK